MELQAVISGLSELTRRTRVEVITDSKYVAQGCESWMSGWKKNGWKRKVGNTLIISKPHLNIRTTLVQQRFKRPRIPLGFMA